MHSDDKPDQSTFMAWTLRTSMIMRWGRMHCFRQENVSEHSHQVAAIAHLLTVISNHHCGTELSPDKAASLGVFHDINEVLLQDANSKVKYHSPEFTKLYKQTEEMTEIACVNTLPDYLQPYYRQYIIQSEVDPDYIPVLKAADKISALFKAQKETELGNTEFKDALVDLRRTVEVLAEKHAFVRFFMDTFAESCTVSVDGLIRRDQAHREIAAMTNRSK